MRYSLLKLKLDIPLVQYRHNYTGQFIMVCCKHLYCAHLKGVPYFGRSSRVPDSAMNIYIYLLHCTFLDKNIDLPHFFPLLRSVVRGRRKPWARFKGQLKTDTNTHTDTPHTKQKIISWYCLLAFVSMTRCRAPVLMFSLASSGTFTSMSTSWKRKKRIP